MLDDLERTKRVRAAMGYMGIKNAELADLIDAPVATVNNWFRADNGTIPKHRLGDILRAITDGPHQLPEAFFDADLAQLHHIPLSERPATPAPDVPPAGPRLPPEDDAPARRAR